jgi:hypothetical protein
VTWIFILNINEEHTLTLILAYWPALSIVLILMLFGVFFFVPGWAGVTAWVVFSLSMAMTIFSVLQKHRNLYQEKPTSKIKLVCNILFEIMGILLAMLLAGLLARYIAQLVTQQISNDLIGFAAGISTGLLVGIGVGILIQFTWGRLIKTFSEN